MISHVPVMINQTMEALNLHSEGAYWDGTFGLGGHSKAILTHLSPNSILYASDRDEAAVSAARNLIDDHRFHFIRGSLSRVLDQIPDRLSGFLWDLGCSSPQLKDPERGFSFRENGPLDMRMDREQSLTAADLVNDLPEKDLADTIYKYGEERFSRAIAKRIVQEREETPITDTKTLAEICRNVYPRRYHRIDPATRTFQGLRIAVNDELGELENTLPRALKRLEEGGRAVIISFHSLEDRIVKHCFREHAKTGPFQVITKRPLVPEEQEKMANPASRSAKFRVLSRIARSD